MNIYCTLALFYPKRFTWDTSFLSVGPTYEIDITIFINVKGKATEAKREMSYSPSVTQL